MGLRASARSVPGTIRQEVLIDGRHRLVTDQPVRISAQARLQRFYTELGFSVASAEYLEDGLAHLEMLWRPT